VPKSVSAATNLDLINPSGQSLTSRSRSDLFEVAPAKYGNGDINHAWHMPSVTLKPTGALLIWIFPHQDTMAPETSLEVD
jgi:hypothetical protein